MASNLASLLVKISGDTTGLQKAMDTAKKQNASFTQTLMKNSRMIGASFTALGGAITAMGVMSVKTYANMGDEVQKMALKTGFSTEALSEWRHAAELSGTELGSLDKAVKRMSKTIVDATDGMATYVRAFDRIGLSAEDLIDLNPEKQFETIAMALAGVENQAIKAASAQDIFGRSGTMLLPMLEQGADGIERMKEEAHELGIVFDQEAADKAAKMTDDMLRLKRSTDGFKIAIGEALIPTMDALATKITSVVTKMREWMDDHPVLAGLLSKVTMGLGALLLVLGPPIMMLPLLASGVGMVVKAFVAFIRWVPTIRLAFTSIATSAAAMTGIIGLATIAILELTGAFNKMGDSTPPVGLSLKGVERSLQLLREELVATEKGTDRYNQIIDEIMRLENDRTKLLERERVAQEAMNEVMGEGTDNARDYSDELKTAKDELSAMEDQLAEAERTADEFRAMIADVNDELRDLQSPRLEGMGAYEDQIFNIEQQIKKLELAELSASDSAKEGIREQIDALRDQQKMLELRRDLLFDPQLRELEKAAGGFLGEGVEISKEEALARIMELGGSLPGLQEGLSAAELGVAQQEALIEAQRGFVINIEQLIVREDGDIDSVADEIWNRVQNEVISGG